MMPKVPVQGMTLNMLADGYAGKAIDAGLRRVTEDVIDRGHDGKPRTLTIKLTFTPDATGRCEIAVDVGVKCPGYKPPPTVAKYDQSFGGLAFSPDCAENPDQTTINDIDVDK